MKKIIMGICLMLVGCASIPTDLKTPQIQSYKDMRECSYEAEKAVPTKYRYSKDFDPINTLIKFYEFRTKCLKKRGYHYETYPPDQL